jgi:hypothetical protein
MDRSRLEAATSKGETYCTDLLLRTWFGAAAAFCGLDDGNVDICVRIQEGLHGRGRAAQNSGCSPPSRAAFFRIGSAENPLLRNNAKVIVIKYNHH